MISIAAVLAVHNGSDTLALVLDRLAQEGIETHALDHGSTDGSGDILRSRMGAPVVSLESQPFDGVFRLKQQLAWKTRVIERLESDWVIHIDADEILESPREGEGLRGFIERAEAEGHELVDCDEFIFVVGDEGEDHAGGDFTATMRRYYHFNRPGLRLHRVFRRRPGAAEHWLRNGGHALDHKALSLAPEKLRKRHYIGLSHGRLQGQYLSRVFDPGELAQGWHCNRVATTQDFVRLVPRERTFDLDADGWRTDRPEPQHLIFHQPRPYRAPTPRKASEAHAPMPFVVGVSRSGTTLLRLMLDAHPDLAMTPETHWLGGAMSALRAGLDPDALRQALEAVPQWADMGIDRATLDAVIADAADSPDRFEALRGLYRAYAAAHGAARVGDKTPNHGERMLKIAEALPEARFIHIIRDGRDVAVSQRGLWFGPGDDPGAAARFWAWRIREARQQAQFLPHYMEVRYEALVTDPEPVLRRIGDFIDLPFHPRQLAHADTAAERLAELGDVARGGGTVTSAQRRALHALALEPAQPGRIGRWRREMSPPAVAAFQQVAGHLLTDLGYELG